MNDSSVAASTKPRSRYVRSVSPMERFSLVLHGVHRYHVDGVVEGVGTVDAGVLQAAVNRAAEANPAIRVRLRGVLRWARWVDSGIAPQVKLLPPADWDGSSEQGQAFLETRLEPMKGGPIAEVFIVPCTDGRTRLIFRTVHAAIDGRGFLHWVAEVCRALRGEPLQGSDSNLTDYGLQLQLADKVGEDKHPAPTACIPVVPPSAHGRELRYVWRRAIVPNNVSQLLPKTAVFLAEYARRREAGEVGFTVPVDFRGLRTQEMGLGNLTGYLRIGMSGTDGTRNFMQQLNQKLKAFIDVRAMPGVSKLYWLPIRWLVHKSWPQVDRILYTVTAALPSAGVVSMGNMRPETYSFPGFDAHMLFGIPGAVGKLNVVFLNYPDFVVTSFSAPAAYNADGQLDGLVAAYIQHFSKPVSEAVSDGERGA